VSSELVHETKIHPGLLEWLGYSQYGKVFLMDDKYLLHADSIRCLVSTAFKDLVRSKGGHDSKKKCQLKQYRCYITWGKDR
jgi:hypothetical protein